MASEDEIRPGEMRRLDFENGGTCHVAHCGACEENTATTPRAEFEGKFYASNFLLSRGWRNIPPFAWCCPACVRFIQSVEGQA